jgi:hypothetical protein
MHSALSSFANSKYSVACMLSALSVYAIKYSVTGKLSALLDIINGLGPQQVALNINIQYNMFPALSTNAVFAQCAFIRFASRYCITVQYCVPLDIGYATNSG